MDNEPITRDEIRAVVTALQIASLHKALEHVGAILDARAAVDPRWPTMAEVMTMVEAEGQSFH